MGRAVCPECGPSGSVFNIADVIDANTMNSETHGAVFGWSSSNFVDISTVDLYTTSTTRLARRFFFPANPGVPTGETFALWWILGSIGSGFLLAKLEHLGGLEDFYNWLFGVYFFAAFLGLPISLIACAIKWVGGRSQSRLWKENRQIAFSGNYCFACGTAFDQYLSGNPEGFVSGVFDGTRETYKQRALQRSQERGKR